MTGERTVGLQKKSFRTDRRPDFLVGCAADRKNRLFADVQHLVPDASLKDVDRRGAEEFCHKQAGGIVINLLGMALLHQDSVLHHGDPVTDTHGLVLVMGDENGGNPGFLLNLPDLFPGLEAQAGVQIGQRLVQQKNPGEFYKSTGNRHTLLLAAGQLSRFAVHQILNLYKMRGLGDPLFHFLFCETVFAPQVLQRELNVLADVQVRIESIILKNHADAPQFRGKLCHILFSEKDFSSGGSFEAADHVQCSALSAAGRTQQTHQFTVRDFAGEITYCGNVAGILFPAGREFFCQVFQYNFHFLFLSLIAYTYSSTESRCFGAYLKSAVCRMCVAGCSVFRVCYRTVVINFTFLIIANFYALLKTGNQKINIALHNVKIRFALLGNFMYDEGKRKDFQWRMPALYSQMERRRL